MRTNARPSFRVKVYAAGLVGAEMGWDMDFADTKRAFRPITNQLDHNCLNDVAGLDNPTRNNLARRICRRLKPALPILSKLVVCETCASGCI